MKNAIKHILVVTFLSLAVSGVQAQQKQNFIEFTTKAFKEVEVADKNNGKKTKLVEPGTAIPGDEIFYVITFKNTGDQAVSNIQIDDPIPNNSMYKLGSAFGAGTDIVFSIDGGKTYAKLEELLIANSDGTKRPAKAEEYSNIRWIYKAELQPGQEATVTFRTIIEQP